MKRISLLLTATLAASLWVPARAQTLINAPAGWKTQLKNGGARTFIPPDLQAGEVYSVTTYDSAPLEGATLEEYLRKFGGPVGNAPGKLAKPLQIKVSEGRVVSGTGVYVGPNGTALGAMFLGVSLDGGGNIHVSRTLFSGQGELSTRYKEENGAILSALAKRARAEAGSNVEVMPSVVRQKLKTLGGELKPGVYAGNQFRDAELERRYRVYIFANGEYLLCDQNDQNITKRYFDELAGEVRYNRNTGKLNIDWTMGLGTYSDNTWCYYGRDANGKPAIYAEADHGFSTSRVTLTYVGPPTKRVSKSEAAAFKAAQEAERNRFKWVTKPGKGVPNSKIAAILLDSKFNGQSVDESVYLLLKDGSVYADLPVPPDELDVLKSKQREPAKWGKWRKVGKSYRVSWEGAPYQDLPGFAVAAAPAQTKLAGRFGTGRSSGIIGMSSSYALWGVSFTKTGRFRKDSRGGSSSSIGFGDNATHVNSGYDDEGSFGGASGANFAVSSSTKKKNPNGAREGDYSLNGYVLTLRYDNGKVARLPFFFTTPDRKGVWFEGSSMSRD